MKEFSIWHFKYSTPDSWLIKDLDISKKLENVKANFTLWSIDNVHM